MKEFFKKNEVFLIIVIGALVISGSVYFLSKRVPTSLPESGVVTKVIDGDTVILEEKFKIRLLGIDTDELKEPCYEVAKSRLKELILNKEVILEKDQKDVDIYRRFLRYIFLEDQNINLQLVKEGLASSLFYEPSLKYKEEIITAEKEAKINKIGCEWRK